MIYCIQKRWELCLDPDSLKIERSLSQSVKRQNKDVGSGGCISLPLPPRRMCLNWMEKIHTLNIKSIWQEPSKSVIRHGSLHFPWDMTERRVQTHLGLHIKLASRNNVRGRSSLPCWRLACQRSLRVLAMFYFGRRDEERTVPFHGIFSYLACLVRSLLMRPDTKLTEAANHTEFRTSVF